MAVHDDMTEYGGVLRMDMTSFSKTSHSGCSPSTLTASQRTSPPSEGLHRAPRCGGSLPRGALAELGRSLGGAWDADQADGPAGSSSLPGAATDCSSNAEPSADGRRTEGFAPENIAD